MEVRRLTSYDKYTDTESYVLTSHGKELRILSEQERHVMEVAQRPPYMYTSLCPDARYRR